jgi:tetratricopeptide (TPR) repeat protein
MMKMFILSTKIQFRKAISFNLFKTTNLLYLIYSKSILNKSDVIGLSEKLKNTKNSREQLSLFLNHNSNFEDIFILKETFERLTYEDHYNYSQHKNLWENFIDTIPSTNLNEEDRIYFMVESYINLSKISQHNHNENTPDTSSFTNLSESILNKAIDLISSYICSEKVQSENINLNLKIHLLLIYLEQFNYDKFYRDYMEIKKSLENDSKKVRTDLLNKLAQHLVKMNYYQDALFIYQINTSRLSNFSTNSRIENALLIISEFDFSKCNFTLSLEDSFKSIKKCFHFLEEYSKNGYEILEINKFYFDIAICFDKFSMKFAENLDFEKALIAYNKASEIFKLDKCEKHLDYLVMRKKNKAMILENLSLYEDSIIVYREFIEELIKNSDIDVRVKKYFELESLIRIGIMYFDLEEVPNSLEILTKVYKELLILNNEDSEAMNENLHQKFLLLGLGLKQLKEYEMSIQCYEKVMNDDRAGVENFLDSWFNKAEILYLQGNLSLSKDSLLGIVEYVQINQIKISESKYQKLFSLLQKIEEKTQAY